MTTILTDTGVFARFSDAAEQQDDSVRRALTALGHLAALVTAVVAIAATTISSIVGTDSVLASGPALIGAYTLIAYVGAGIFKNSFRYTVSGLLTTGGLAAMMAVGHYLYQDAVFFGQMYLGFAVIVAFTTGVVWLDVRLNGRP